MLSRSLVRKKAVVVFQLNHERLFNLGDGRKVNQMMSVLQMIGKIASA